MKDKLLLKILTFLILVLNLLLIGCTSKEYSSNPNKYVKQAFDSIEFYSRHRLTFNFDSLETRVLKKISDSSSYDEVIELLETALKSIDKHNYIIPHGKYYQMKTGTNHDVLTNPYPFQCKMLDEKYAFVALSGFIGVDSISSKNYTDSLQRSILWLYNQQPKGWIIDL